MNKLKKIYYPILATVFIIALVLGLVFSQVNVGAKADKNFVSGVKAHLEYLENVHNTYKPDNQQAVRDYVTSTLFDNGIYAAEDDRTDGYRNAEIDGATYLVQTAELNEEDLQQSNEDELFYTFKTVNNIIIAIPGKSDDAVLFMANYDSAFNSQSGIESMQAAALLQAAIEAAKDYDAEKIPQKTLLFVLTDAEHEGAYGAYAFKNLFKGFGGITDKIELAVNFGAQGTGALAVASKGISVSSVTAVASELNEALDGLFAQKSDYDIFDCAKINVFFTGSREYLNTPRDTVKNVSEDKIYALGGAMKSLVKAYGYDDKFNETNGAMASVVGITFSYDNAVAYALGGLSLVLLALAVIFMIIKSKKAGGLVKGIFVQLLNFVATGLILYVCYFVIALLLAGFGVLPVIAITSVRYLNLGIFISSLILAFAAYSGVFLLTRRFLKVKATDAVRGGAVIIILGCAALCFALPSASIFFALTAVLEGAALIFASIFANKFRDKFGMDIERLFLYTIPLILFTPAIIPVLVQAGYTLSAVYLPLILLVAVLGFTVIAPYFGLLKPVLVKAVSKLPKHTIRVEKEVTERVEGAKKGRNTVQEVKVKKIVNEKVEWKYRNRYGIILLGILSSLVIILCAVCPAPHFSTNIAETFSFREGLKDNSLVYHWEQQGSDAAIETLRVYDKVAYSYFGRVDNEFAYDRQIDAYVKNFRGNINSLLGTNEPVTILLLDDDNGLKFNTYNLANESFISVKLTNVADVTKFTIKTERDEYEILNDGKDTLILELPYSNNDYGTFSIIFEHTEELNVGVEYDQYVYGDRTERIMSSNENSLVEYFSIRSAFASEDYYNEISCGMIFHKENYYTL